MPNELPDTAEALHRQETAHVLPRGWLFLTAGLIAWGLIYLFLYSPWASGWTQAGAMEGTSPEAGASVFATVLFTVLPAAAAAGLWLLQRSGPPRPPAR
jgi:hypothetical protein